MEVMLADPLNSFLEEPTQERFTDLVRATTDDVFQSAWRVLGDRDRAEDVVQEVYLKVLRAHWKPGKVRTSRGFLVSTALLLARSRRRAEARRASHEARSAGERERRATLDRQPGLPLEDLWDLRDALARLPRRLRSCVDLRYFA